MCCFQSCAHFLFLEMSLCFVFLSTNILLNLKPYNSFFTIKYWVCIGMCNNKVGKEIERLYFL